MKATVITIGDEILIGQIIDTNSAWIGQQFNEFGVKIHEIISCGDDATQITQALDRAKSTSQIVLMTGGLGPTKDDITKKTLVDYFNTELELNEEVWAKMKQFFEKRGLAVLEMNRSQAMIPKASTMLPNLKGTAQGMWFDIDGVVFISMPGVPHEMKHLMETQVIPRLKQKFTFPKIIHSTLSVAGAGESVIANMLKEFEEQIPASIKLAYLPEFGVVRLRLTGSGEGEALKKQIEEQKAKIKAALGNFVYSDADEKLYVTIGKMLVEKKATISCAESCTGGHISHLLTSIEGSSAYFEGSVIAYSYDVKEKLLGVTHKTLQTYGAVSSECVTEMLDGLLKATGTTYGIAITGIAGPGGGTPEKPVGTVWIAVGSQEKKLVKKFQFFTTRMENIRVFSNAALNMLRLFIAE
ncbi:MAG: CinA family nicotinamide mononucleotide deamidase-related protein [Bacteroidota bacterium]|nr:CinA family nicotinamide mononucleotide deamidase-related protein [Bacteroidota bacterium]